MILFVRQSHKKRTHIDNRKITESTSDVNTNNINPSNTTTVLHNDDYDYVIHDDLYQDDDQDAVEMEDNPSYGRNQVSAHNTTNPHPNSSYSSNLRPNS